jgi:hypothetical protein
MLKLALCPKYTKRKVGFDRVLAHIKRDHCHQWLAFYLSLDRQLNIVVAVLAAFVTFVGCVFSGALTITSSLLIAAGVLVGLLLGRRIIEVAFTLFR